MASALQAWKRAPTARVATILGAVVAAGMSLLAAAASSAQPYPARLIKLVLPLPAGSIVDTAARLVAPALSARLGQPVIVENRPGGGGTVAATTVATAAPDGYTLLFVGVNHVFAPALSRTANTDPVKDFTAIASMVTFPWVLVVPPAVPASSVKELVDYAKTHPQELNWGFGQATGPHLLGELFLAATGIEVTRIPYKGGTQAMPDMLGGRIQINFGTVSNVVPLVQAGKLRALAVTGEARSPELPDVPTMAESGLPRLTLGSWTGLLAPAGTPAGVVTRLNSEINAIMATPEMKAAMAKLGFEAKTGSPQDFAAFIGDQIAVWGTAARLAGLKPE
jgi:tripartite-type tricarboxylate transporter receptor subunit TctC